MPVNLCSPGKPQWWEIPFIVHLEKIRSHNTRNSWSAKANRSTGPSSDFPTCAECKGSEQLRMATPIQARIPGFGDMLGQVFGHKRNGAQAYGFDLGFQPGRTFLES